MRLALLLILFCATPAFSQWANGYTYRVTLTVDHTKVPNTDQTNFTVEIDCSSCAALKTVANGGTVQSASGFDIIFTSDLAGSTLLSWEQETWSATTGAAIYHVLIPTLSHTVDTPIYMFYGKAGVGSFQGGALGAAWDSNFKGVWHLPNGSSLTALDSTSNANNGTVNGAVTAVAGKVDGAASFPGTGTANVDLGSGGTLNITGDLTLSAWVNLSAGGDVVSKFNINGYFMASHGTNGLEVGIYGGSTGGRYNGTPFNTSTWHHIVGVYKSGGSADVFLYFDGAPSAGTLFGTIPSASISSGGNPFIAKNQSGIGNAAGTIDEVRISNSQRSADWIATEYNNQSSPSTFYSTSAPACNPGPCATPARRRFLF